MNKWLRKHYALICMLVLAIIFVSWTSFVNASDNKLRENAVSFIGDNSSNISVNQNTSGADVIADTAENTNTTGDTDGSVSDNSENEVAVGTSETVVSADTTDGGQVSNTEKGDNAGNVTEVADASGNTADGLSETTDIAGNTGDGTDTNLDSSVNTTDTADASAEAVSDGGVASSDTDSAASGNPDTSESTDSNDSTEAVPENETPDETQEFVLTFKYAIANVSDRLNIRSGKSIDTKLVGYLGANGYCEVLEYGEEWTKIKSGYVTGYAYTPLLIFNNQAIERLQNLNKLFVRVKANKLNIRAEANTESSILGHATNGSKYIYLPEKSVDGWYCIQYSETQVGYLSDQYTEIYIDTKPAVSVN